MCLILFAHRVHPEFPLVVAANRDELHDRPTAPAGFWPDAPDVLAGRDLRAGGTWLGITRTGRWAALTNVHDPQTQQAAGGPSRGELVTEFLTGDLPAEEYLRYVAGRMSRYAGFNLLLGDAGGVFYIGNRGGGPKRLAPGVYGLSNHLLDTPWPKVTRGKQALGDALAGTAEPDAERLFQILADTDPAPDADLPGTGMGREWERALSSLFIVGPTYGTRSSTVLMTDRHSEATLIERAFLPGPRPGGELVYRFSTASPAEP